MTDKKSAIDKDLVSDLAKILNDTDLTEIEIEHGELRIRVSREPAPQYVSHQPMQAPAMAAQAAPAPAAAPASAPAAGDAPKAKKGGEVPSPMVGTAYLSPAPDAAPFLSVGQKVDEGETLLIIEAMKVMNQIPAPRAGTITEILVTDGEPVEYGQALVIIE